MSGYFGDPEATQQVLSPDGWLDTGDLGYRIGNSFVVTGREKDLIILNGRNIWPQDLEYLAEQQTEVRTGDASAFSVPGPDGEEKAVLVIQCRVSDVVKRASLWASTVLSSWYLLTHCPELPPGSCLAPGHDRIF